MDKSLIEKELPELWSSYNAMAKNAMREGVLSSKIKELIAVALSIAVKCEPCIMFHLTKSIKSGTTKKEIAETLGITLLLLGGPSDVWPRETINNVIKEMSFIYVL